MEQGFRCRAVIFRENDAWVSQCIEHDLNGQGSTIREAVNSLSRVLITQAQLDELDGVPMLSRTNKPPERYIAMFENSIPLADAPGLPKPTQGAELRIHA
jgi:hypothetical protein